MTVLSRKPTGWIQGIPEGGIMVDSATQRLPLGTLVQDTLGNVYRYIKASEAIAYGELVTHVALAAWDTSIVVDGAVTTNTQSYIHVDGVVTAVDADYYKDYYVSQAADGAGTGQLFKIKSHPAFAASGEYDVTFFDTISEAFANNEVLYIFNPYLMELVDGGTEVIRGVGIGTITSGNYGFVQVGGVVTGVLCDGSNGAATVLDEPIVPYSTDPGQGQGMAGSAEGDIMEAHASPLIALEACSTDAAYVPAYFTRIV